MVLDQFFQNPLHAQNTIDQDIGFPKLPLDPVQTGLSPIVANWQYLYNGSPDNYRQT